MGGHYRVGGIAVAVVVVVGGRREIAGVGGSRLLLLDWGVGGSFGDMVEVVAAVAAAGRVRRVSLVYARCRCGCERR